VSSRSQQLNSSTIKATTSPRAFPKNQDEKTNGTTQLRPVGLLPQGEMFKGPGLSFGNREGSTSAAAASLRSAALGVEAQMSAALGVAAQRVEKAISG